MKFTIINDDLFNQNSLKNKEEVNNSVNDRKKQMLSALVKGLITNGPKDFMKGSTIEVMVPADVAAELIDELNPIVNFQKMTLNNVEDNKEMGKV